MKTCPVCSRKYRFVFCTGLCYDCTQFNEETNPCPAGSPDEDSHPL